MPETSDSSLSPLEKQVAQALVDCDTQAEAARTCFVSERKYKAIVAELKDRFGCSNTRKLVLALNAQKGKEDTAG